VIAEGDDIFGAGVNIAARLEALAGAAEFRNMSAIDRRPVEAMKSRPRPRGIRA
jgi:class 3 adenylate cyclase